MKAKNVIICHIEGKPVKVQPGQELPAGIPEKDLDYLKKRGVAIADTTPDAEVQVPSADAKAAGKASGKR